MCKISIVLPVYNGEDHISYSIESILNQEFDEYELIIVNDCSKDNTQKIIEEYAKKDRRIVVVNNEVNKKLPASLNVGFRLAQGKYLTWTSHDNAYKKYALGTMYKMMEENPNCGLVYCDYDIINEQGKVVRENKMGEPDDIVRGNVVGACFLYKKTVAEKVGEYDTNMFLAEDYDYWLRIYKETTIIHIKENLYQYRHHEKSLSATRLIDIKKQTARLWMKHIDFLVEKLKNRKDRFQFFDLLYGYADDNDKKEIVKYFISYDKLYILKYAKMYLKAKIKGKRG